MTEFIISWSIVAMVILAMIPLATWSKMFHDIWYGFTTAISAMRQLWDDVFGGLVWNRRVGRHRHGLGRIPASVLVPSLRAGADEMWASELHHMNRVGVGVHGRQAM